MRVLHVVPSLDPVYGGPGRVTTALSRALVGAGAEVDVVTTDVSVPDSGEARSGTEAGVSTYYFRRGGRGSYVFSLPLTKWLWRHARRYDLFHIHTVFAYPTLAASRIARHAGVPYILSPHGMLEPWCLAYKGWKKRPYMKAIERSTLAGAAALHALAPEEQRNIKALSLDTPTFVIPNGVHADEFAGLPPRAAFEAEFPAVSGRKVLLFMGRVDPKKGLDLLVKSLAQLTRRGTGEKICLVIAGPDLIGYRSELEGLIRDEAVGDSVVFTGMLDGELKRAALSAADVFALPSHSEGFSVAVLEAMAAGRPVVISEGCNFPQVSAAGAGKVIKTDVAPLTAALAELLSDENSRRLMGERGASLVRDAYDWSSIARRMKSVYSDVVARRRTSEVWDGVGSPALG